MHPRHQEPYSMLPPRHMFPHWAGLTGRGKIKPSDCAEPRNLQLTSNHPPPQILLTDSSLGTVFCLWRQGVNIAQPMTLAQLNKPGLGNNIRTLQLGLPVLLCSLPFFANKTATSVPGTTGSNVTTHAKKTKSDQPKQPSDGKHVAKHVTIDQCVDKYGKYAVQQQRVFFLEML